MKADDIDLCKLQILKKTLKKIKKGTGWSAHRNFFFEDHYVNAIQMFFGNNEHDRTE